MYVLNYFKKLSMSGIYCKTWIDHGFITIRLSDVLTYTGPRSVLIFKKEEKVNQIKYQSTAHLNFLVFTGNLEDNWGEGLLLLLILFLTVILNNFFTSFVSSLFTPTLYFSKPVRK